MTSLTKAGASPIKRFKPALGNSYKNSNEKAKNNADSNKQEKTYFDEEGVRRCNRRLKSGERCERPVTEREGKYGSFWSCPNFKEHSS